MSVRFVIWTIYAAVSLTISVFFIILFAMFPYRVRLAFCKAWCVSMLYVGRWLCGIRYVVEGVENLPGETRRYGVSGSALARAGNVRLFQSRTMRPTTGRQRVIHIDRG